MSIDDRLPPLNDGCNLHPHCLTCPRPTCIYDDIEAQQQQRSAELRGKGGGRRGSRAPAVLVAEVLRLEKEDATAKQAMEATGISRSTLYRIRAEARKAGTA